jgi:D-glycero-D-manno-heptose 1,7-bisphosphate phosphatase
MKQRAIFLDRDGVLNDAIIKNGKPYPPASLDEVNIATDVLPALQSLKNAGFLLLGATNQPDVARGKTERSLVEAINKMLMDKLPLDEIRVCYHDDADKCECRKPLPGLILQAAEKFNVDLSNSVMIGDRWKDVEAGQRAGCKTIWIDRGYAVPKPSQQPDVIVKSMNEAGKWIEQLCAN